MTTASVTTNVTNPVTWIPFPLGKSSIKGVEGEGNQILEATMSFPDNFDVENIESPNNLVKVDATFTYVTPTELAKGSVLLQYGYNKYIENQMDIVGLGCAMEVGVQDSHVMNLDGMVE